MKVEKHLSSLPIKLSSIDISKFLKVLPVKINGKIMDFINSKHEYNEPFTSHDEKILVKQLKAKTRLVSLGDKNLTRKGIISKKFKNGFYSSLEENSDIANFMVKFENENFTAFTH